MRREEDSEEGDEERGNHGEQDSGSFGLFIHQNETAVSIFRNHTKYYPSRTLLTFTSLSVKSTSLLSTSSSSRGFMSLQTHDWI